MNICLLSDKYPPDVGGLAASTRRLARGLTDRGHSVHVCVLSGAVAPGQVDVSHPVPGLSLHRLGRFKRADDSLQHWFRYGVQRHQQTPFDLLHGYYLVEAAFVTVYAGRYLSRPTLVSARGNDLDRAVFDPRKAANILWALNHADIVTAVSTDLGRRARALAPASRVEVVFNAVDTEQFRPLPPDPALQARLGLDNRPTVGFVGEARYKKGLTILLPAMARLAEIMDPAPRLLLIGGVRRDDSDYVRVFQAKYPAVPLTMVPYVAQAQLPPYYNLLDVLALPSLADGLPNAALEGAACGCAIVAADVGGLPDVIRPEENGLLIPTAQIEPLVAALRRLLADPAHRAALGEAARRTAVEQFSPAHEVDANLALYEELRIKN